MNHFRCREFRRIQKNTWNRWTGIVRCRRRDAPGKTHELHKAWVLGQSYWWGVKRKVGWWYLTQDFDGSQIWKRGRLPWSWMTCAPRFRFPTSFGRESRNASYGLTGKSGWWEIEQTLSCGNHVQSSYHGISIPVCHPEDCAAWHLGSSRVWAPIINNSNILGYEY